jgi:hypothetical protein
MVVVVMVVVVAWEYYEIVAGIFKREYSGATVIGVHDLRLYFDHRLTARHSRDSCRFQCLPRILHYHLRSVGDQGRNLQDDLGLQRCRRDNQL